MPPSVSVVIPTYNQAKLLAGAVASVRAQGWPDLEVIVVDDGSTDETADVLARLGAGGGLRWFRQPNAGAAAARNRGIREARGEWVAFLDADDFWLPGKLAAQFEALGRAPSAAFGYTDIRFRFDGGEERDHTSPLRGPLLWRLLAGNFFATPSAVVRRDCFERVGLFDPELRTGEDWEMWLRLAAHFECAWVGRPLAVVRVAPPGTLKHTLPTLERCTLRVLARLFACPRVARDWPEVAAKRRLVYAWHCSVLARSYLSQRLWKDFTRLAARAVREHPAGLAYVSGLGRLGRELGPSQPL